MAKKKKKEEITEDCGCEDNINVIPCDDCDEILKVRVKNGYRLFVNGYIYIREQIVKLKKSDLVGQEFKVEVLNG